MQLTQNEKRLRISLPMHTVYRIIVVTWKLVTP